MAIEDKCFEYLKSVNPIAQKIGEDIEGIKENNKSDWNSLDHKGKERIIDETLIDLKLAHKYKSSLDINDEDANTFSSSFSWFSRSQLNLFTYINVKPEKNKTPSRKTDVFSPQKKTRTTSLSKISESSTKPLKNKNTKDDKPEKICSKNVAKPKTPPPPPPAKLVPVEQKYQERSNTQHIDDIPKTGFDFLDNW